MAQNFLKALALPLLVLGAPLFAFQSAPFQNASVDTPVTIVPRTRTPAPPAAEEAPPAHLRVDTSLVLIPVHVSTQLGTTVTNLTRENFRLFEESAEQSITYFAKDDAPISVGVLLDMSGSMQDKMRKAAEAAAKFFQTANTHDQFFLVEFSERARLTVPFTADSDEVYRRITRARPYGRTSLYDAVHVALAEMKKARHARKALLILSDGGDNCSRHTFSQVRNELLESDVQVYAMGVFDQEESRRKTTEEREGPRVLDSLADVSGGRHYPVADFNDLPEIAGRIGTELRNQYLVGYAAPLETRDGRYRRVKLTVVNYDQTAPLRVQYRHGYHTPNQ
jgi:Ca-activated chloride channel family protein